LDIHRRNLRDSAPARPWCRGCIHSFFAPMPNIRFLEHPDHWLKRAERVRLIAEQTDDPASKELLLRIAEDMERLAEHARRGQDEVSGGMGEGAQLVCQSPTFGLTLWSARTPTEMVHRDRAGISSDARDRGRPHRLTRGQAPNCRLSVYIPHNLRPPMSTRSCKRAARRGVSSAKKAPPKRRIWSTASSRSPPTSCRTIWYVKCVIGVHLRVLTD
jgi:hypothetical protein